MKKLMTIVVLLSMMFLVSTVSAITWANEAYTDIGGGGTQDYLQWNGEWYENTEGEIYMSAGVSDLAYTPLVADLDGDGNRDILAVTSTGAFKIYNRTDADTLSLVNGWSESSTIEAPPIIFDINGDGTKDIIYATDDNIEIYSIVAGIPTKIAEHDISANFSDYIDGDAVLNCRESNECLWVGSESKGREFDGDNDLKALSFSTSQIESVIQIAGVPDSNSFWCMPDIRTMPIDDIELDSSKRWVFSAMEVDSFGNEQIRLYTVWMNSTDVSDIALDENSLVYTKAYGSSQTCGLGDYGQYFSSPLINNFDDSINSKMPELFIGYSIGSDDWEINEFSSTLSSVTTCGGVTGEKMSNLYRCLLYWDDIGSTDVCMNTYDNSNDRLEVLSMGNTKNTGEISTRCQKSDYDTPYDISYDNPYTLISHSGRWRPYSYEYLELNDAYASSTFEIANPYGVMLVEWTALSNTNMDDNPTLIYPSPLQNTTLIFDAITGTDDDIIGYTDDRIFMIDDNSFDQNAYVSDWEWNPCITDTIKVNTSTEVKMTITDPDSSNDVQGRVIWYYPTEDYGEISREIIYDSLNESESDGVAENVSSFIMFGHATTIVGDGSIMLKDIDSGTVNEFEFTIGSTFGSPDAQNFVYDFYICPTQATSLSTTPVSQCSSSRTLVADDVDLSSLFATGVGVRSIPFDSDYQVSETSNYIFFWKYVSSDLVGSHWWTAKIDNNPTSSYTSLSVRTLADNSTINITYTDILPFRLIYNSEDTHSYDSGWTSVISSGSTFTHSITADQIVSNGVVRLMARDTAHEDDYTYVDFPFNVQKFGVEHGQTECNGGQDVEGALNTSTTGVITNNVDDVNDNAIKNTMDTAKSDLGFRGWSYTSLWFFLMFLISIGIWFTPINDSVEHQGVLKLGATILIDMTLLFLGLKFGFIGLGTILLVGVIALAVVIISFRRSAVGA